MTSGLKLSDLERSKTCLMIIDMQNDFLKEGATCEIRGGRAVIPAVVQLLEAARAAKVPVLHVITVWRKDGVDLPKFRTASGPVYCLEGTAGAEITPELTPKGRDYVVIKKRYSGFFHSDLELLLRSLGVDHIITAGVATNYCVRATVHDASFLGWNCWVVREGVTSYTAAEHEASLKDIAAGFGYVVGLEETLRLLGTWKRAGAP